MRCAILDVVSWFPGVLQQLWIDVSVRWVAAVAGETEKTKRHDTAVRSLGAKLLRDLVTTVAANRQCRPHAVGRWMTQLERVLLTALGSRVAERPAAEPPLLLAEWSVYRCAWRCLHGDSHMKLRLTGLKTKTETEVWGALRAACHPLCVASLCQNCFLHLLMSEWSDVTSRRERRCAKKSQGWRAQSGLRAPEWQCCKTPSFLTRDTCRGCGKQRGRETGRVHQRAVTDRGLATTEWKSLWGGSSLSPWERRAGQISSRRRIWTEDDASAAEGPG